MSIAATIGLYAAAAVGAICILRVVSQLAATAVSALTPGGRGALAKYQAKESAGTWAVVTGASDGIGREFALQLAKSGFGVVLISRSETKLQAVADEIAAGSAERKLQLTRVLPMDFASATDAHYARLENVLRGLDVGILVNNVGVNHEIPTPFLEEDPAVIERIVNVNISAQMKMTRLIAPGMVARGTPSLILNIGSVAGTVPSGLLSVYSASKSFLRYWSVALAMELRAVSKVHVEHVTTYFVTTAMSKIRRSSITTPTARDYVAGVLARVGRSIDSAPYPAHGFLVWLLENFTTESMRVEASNKMHVDIRKRALKKRQREAEKK